MAENYVGTHWRDILTKAEYTIIYQTKPEHALPSTQDSQTVVLRLNPGTRMRPNTGQYLITAPIGFLLSFFEPMDVPA